MDGEAWWAAVHEVAQSRTRLKRLSSSSAIQEGLPGGSVVKNQSAHAGDVGLIPGWETKILQAVEHSSPQTQKMRMVHTMDYYSAIKKNEILLFATTWMDLKTSY